MEGMGACGIHSLLVCFQRQQLGRLGPTRTGTPAAGTGVCRLAGISKFLPEKRLPENQKKLLRSAWNEQGMNHRRLGPSKSGIPAAGTGVCRPAGVSKLLPGKIPACKNEEKAAVSGSLCGMNKE